MAIRLLLVDDHEVVRMGLRALLSREPDFVIVGEASSGEEAVELAAKTRPDVVVMDVRMPGMGGVQACREIRSAHPEVKVIMLTSYADEEAVIASVMAGASGYVLKQIGSRDLIEGIRKVAAGHSLLDPAVAGKVLERLRGGGHEAGHELPERLTEQERRILALIAQGKTNREIAAQLYLSEKTVRNYVSNLLGKLGVSNRAGAAALAIREGLIDGPTPRSGT